MIRVRPGTAAGLPAPRELIPRSVGQPSRGFYTPAQVESALRRVFGPDTALIADGTYFLAETADRGAAGGGWSRRQTLYGGDQIKAAVPHAVGDELLDPATEGFQHG